MKVIGLTGPSCSGKTQLAKELQTIIDSSLISVDYFYKRHAPKIYVPYKDDFVRTFERAELYDGELVAEIIDELQEEGTCTFEQRTSLTGEFAMKTLEKKPYLIVEGFLCFSYPALFEKMDYKFFLDLPDKEILQRREERAGRPVSDVTFKKIGLDEYHAFGEKQKYLDGVVVLDGTQSQRDLITRMRKYVGF